MTDRPSLSAAALSEYDIILLQDRSGSMTEPSVRMPGKNRWEESKEFVLGFANFAQQIDDDGITLITFAGDVTVEDGVKADAVAEVFRKQQPWGSTNLAEALRQALTKVAASGKKTIIVVNTDGEPTNEAAAEQVIVEAARKVRNNEDLAFLFVQVGDDPKAAAYLNRLNDKLQDAYKLPHDIVAVVTREQAESMTPGQLLYEALNG